MQTQNVNDVIDHLAAKLSVPAAHLYGVLVAQVRVTVWQDILTLVVLLGVAGFCAYKRAAIRKMVDDDSDWYPLMWTNYTALFFACVFAIATVGSLIGEISNPEFYALRQLFDAINRK